MPRSPTCIWFGEANGKRPGVVATEILLSMGVGQLPYVSQDSLLVPVLKQQEPNALSLGLVLGVHVCLDLLQNAVWTSAAA
jgi:hypothetical protein